MKCDCVLLENYCMNAGEIIFSIQKDLCVMQIKKDDGAKMSHTDELDAALKSISFKISRITECTGLYRRCEDNISKLIEDVKV